MRLLALDLATRIGFAVGDSDDGGEPTFGAHLLPSTGDDIGSFLVAFDEWVASKLLKTGVAVAIFEMPILPNVTSYKVVRKLYSLASHLEFFCLRNRVNCREVQNRTVKKFWTGSGNAKKPQMIEVARAWGYPLTDKQDDEADAIALYWYSVSLFNPTAAERFAQGRA